MKVAEPACTVADIYYSCEKVDIMCMWKANSKGADQTTHMRNMISTFDVRI